MPIFESKGGRKVHAKTPHIACAVNMSYTDEELIFLKVVERWKRKNGRVPTCGEILVIIKDLGYKRTELPTN